MDDRSTMRILVATDNHLGCHEKDPIRGNDSFDAFEEILQYARDLQVDMMVLAGDLFHDNKPSRKTLHSTMELLRHYCLGERESAVEFLSDPSVNFHSRFANANYLDPNLNVAIPVFAIHGNHDDPTGDGSLSALDILSTAGLLNYFGRVKEVDDITMSPIILRKGATNLALYGLGNIRDERLHRTFTSNRVKMLRPIGLQEADPQNWFNLMLFHQNRAARSPKNHIPEVFLDDFLDLVIWGHEHDCLIDPLYIPQRDFYVCQPGSSCVTSLSEGEALKKHVALLCVKGNQFEMQPLPLRSSRPFVFADLSLREVTEARAAHGLIAKKVEQMIARAAELWHLDHPDRPTGSPLPLIRLRVDYTGTHLAPMNAQRFGQAFSERVANPRDIVHMVRKRVPAGRSSAAAASSAQIDLPAEADRTATRVEDLVAEFLGVQRLDILPHNEFSDTVKIFVEKDDKDAIDAFLKASLARTIGRLNEKHQLVCLRDEIERVRLSREQEWRQLNPPGEALLSHRSSNVNSQTDPSPSPSDGATDDENTANAIASPAKVRPKRSVPLQLSSVGPNRSAAAKETAPAMKKTR